MFPGGVPLVPRPASRPRRILSCPRTWRSPPDRNRQHAERRRANDLPGRVARRGAAVRLADARRHARALRGRRIPGGSTAPGVPHPGRSDAAGDADPSCHAPAELPIGKGHGRYPRCRHGRPPARRRPRARDAHAAEELAPRVRRHVGLPRRPHRRCGSRRRRRRAGGSRERRRARSRRGGRARGAVVRADRSHWTPPLGAWFPPGSSWRLPPWPSS